VSIGNLNGNRRTAFNRLVDSNYRETSQAYSRPHRWRASSIGRPNVVVSGSPMDLRTLPACSCNCCFYWPSLGSGRRRRRVAVGPLAAVFHLSSPFAEDANRCSRPLGPCCRHTFRCSSVIGKTSWFRIGPGSSTPITTTCPLSVHTPRAGRWLWRAPARRRQYARAGRAPVRTTSRRASRRANARAAPQISPRRE
jgi:hypothetical protein